MSTDIGIIGLPNAGKSTLLSRLTMARPRIDNYPFTTLFPNLGVMTSEDDRALIIADIPGLIKGASLGRGLGHRFLKHIERTGLLLHIMDITYLPGRDILEDFHTLNAEMEAYNPGLMEKPQMALINKMDLYGPEHRDLEILRKALQKIGLECFEISALTGKGVDKLKRIIFERWTEFREKS